MRYILRSVAVPNFVSVFHQGNECKETVRRTPSAPSMPIEMIAVPPATPLPVQEIFRRAGNWLRGDVANDSGIGHSGYIAVVRIIARVFRRRRERGDGITEGISFTEGIQLTGYHRLGTIHGSKASIQRRSGSDPSEVANATSLGEAICKLNTCKDSTLRCVRDFELCGNIRGNYTRVRIGLD